MLRKLSLSILISFLPILALAQQGDSYRCTAADQVRRVEIAYSMPGEQIPCEVRYYKDTEAPGEVQTLWRADNLAGYCESQTAEFIGKLEGWGWQCTAGAAAASNDDTAEATAEGGESSEAAE